MAFDERRRPQSALWSKALMAYVVPSACTGVPIFVTAEKPRCYFCGDDNLSRGGEGIVKAIGSVVCSPCMEAIERHAG